MERVRQDRRDDASATVRAAEDRPTVRRSVRTAASVNTGDALAALSVRSSAATWAGGDAAVSKIRRSEAGPGIIRRYRSQRAPDGGDFVGESSACHCHINIGKPHFKVGKDDGSRINFGRDMSVERMQRAYETMLAKHRGKAGFEDCKEYFEEQGCVEPDPDQLIDTLKGMLLKWGGLSDQVFSYYTAAGQREEVDAHSAERLDAEIEAYEEQIRESDVIYNEFLDEGGFTSEQFADLDEDAMEAESLELYEQENRSAKNAAKKAKQ